MHLSIFVLEQNRSIYPLKLHAESLTMRSGRFPRFGHFRWAFEKSSTESASAESSSAESSDAESSSAESDSDGWSAPGLLDSDSDGRETGRATCGSDGRESDDDDSDDEITEQVKRAAAEPLPLAAGLWQGGLILIHSDSDAEPVEPPRKRRRRAARRRTGPPNLRTPSSRPLAVERHRAVHSTSNRSVEPSNAVEPSTRVQDPPSRRISDKTVPETGLNDGEVVLLKSFGVPAAFWRILAMLHFFKFPEADTDCVEYFAGGLKLRRTCDRGASLASRMISNTTASCKTCARPSASCSPWCLLEGSSRRRASSGSAQCARAGCGLRRHPLPGLSRSREATTRFCRSGRATFKPPDQLS